MFEGIILGTMTYISIVVSWFHFPTQIKEWFLTHPVITDLGTAILAWFAISSVSKSIIAVYGAMLVGTLMSLTMLFFADDESSDG